MDPPKGRRVLGKASSTLAVPSPSPLSSSPRKRNEGSPSRVESPAASLQSVESLSSSTSDETANGMFCPICNESMVTLLQLNRHLDDAHSEAEKEENEQIKNWFKKKVEKAKQLQSVTSVFQNGFSKFDLFDQDDPSSTATNSSHESLSTRQQQHHQHTRSNSGSPALTDEVVTRKHWQRQSAYDRCSDILCDKTLNARNGSINCRQCGKLFCNVHTKYQMKLNRNAKHDPTNGVWCRVCETCFKSRKGYNDHSGSSRDLIKEFKQVRQQHIDVRELEVNRLEKRLVKLIDTLRPFGDDSGLLNYTRIQQRRAAERSVANWEDDKQVSSCRLCSQRFGYSLRKHHCRVCGNVVCADLSTGCSKNVQIGILSEKLEKGVAKVPQTSDLNIRMCETCKNTIFAKRNFETEMKSTKPAVLRYYDSMSRLKKSIEMVLPKFQVMLQHINDPEHPPPHETLTEASSIRKKLLDSFFQYENMTRKLLQLNVTGESEKKLQKQIYTVGTQFLQDNLLPLKTVPKVLKHASKPPSRLSAQVDQREELVEGEEQKQLQEQLVVMREQHYLVSQMIEDAKSRRKYDEIPPLEQSLQDLQHEVGAIEARIGDSNSIL